MEREFVLKPKLLYFLVSILIVNQIITFFIIYNEIKDIENFIHTIIFILFSFIFMTFLVIFIEKKRNKIKIFEDYFIFSNWFWRDYKKINLKYSDILEISENSEEKSLKIFSEKLTEKIFYAKNFKNEEEYFEFIEILKQKSGK